MHAARITVAIALAMGGCYRDAPDTSRDRAGVTFREVTLVRAGVPMTLWIYRPTGVATRKRPLILIGAAGTPLMWGMALTKGDRAEHLPWAERGYVVVAYSLDGNVSDRKNGSEILQAIQAFVNAHAGLDNAKAALDFALAHEADVDLARVFAVGHSSAGTLALRVGLEDPRIAATVAMAPVPDVDAWVGKFWGIIDLAHIAGREVLHASSPMTFAAQLGKKPLFLFHADDDVRITAASTQRLFEAIGPNKSNVKFETVPTGNHYDSMIQRGIPDAAAWLETQ